MTERTAGLAAVLEARPHSQQEPWSLFASGRGFSQHSTSPANTPKLPLKGSTRSAITALNRVVGERKDGVDRLYFDTDSGLLLRAWTTFDTALGETPQQTDYEDYRDVGGVKIPYSVHVVSAEGGTRTYKWDQIQVNGTVDESKSNRPAPKPAGPPPAAPAGGGPPRQ